MKPALLLIDLQNDFIDRPGLHPSPEQLLPGIAGLLEGFRAKHLPIVHLRTEVNADGNDRMPHWRTQNLWACVRGTHGAQPPAILSPLAGEPVVAKRFFSGFANTDLADILRAAGVDLLVVAGLYTHGCVRATVVDAYSQGYTVWLAHDGIASPEEEHAQLSLEWLSRRAALSLSCQEIRVRLGLPVATKNSGAEASVPAAWIGGSWHSDASLPLWRHYQPADGRELLTAVPLAGSALLHLASQSVASARAQWAATSTTARIEALTAWATRLAERGHGLAMLMAQEIGKPLTDGLAEINKAIGHLHTTVALLRSAENIGASTDAPFMVRHCPVGTIAMITPWNNPIGITVGKIAPAIAFGNGVIWKPALQAARTTMAVVESMVDTGIPPALIAVLFGASETARQLISHPQTAAITFTGSSRTGFEVAKLTGRLAKPLQAELGGNNGALVMADADLDHAAASLARAAFSFSGQRCTATRRIIVAETVYADFVKLLLAEIAKLETGDPIEAATQVGPLISQAHRDQVLTAVQQAMAHDHGVLLCGGAPPAGRPEGGWCLPTLLDNLAPNAAIVQQETFGPVAVLQRAPDFTSAIDLLNDTSHGLVASLYSRDHEQQKRFIANAQAGIVRINPSRFKVHPDAPFGGWKASGIGPPEHGEWDRQFYTRTQAVYLED